MCEEKGYLLQILLVFPIKFEFFQNKMNFLRKILAKQNRMYYTNKSTRFFMEDIP